MDILHYNHKLRVGGQHWSSLRTECTRPVRGFSLSLSQREPTWAALLLAWDHSPCYRGMACCAVLCCAALRVLLCLQHVLPQLLVEQ